MAEEMTTLDALAGGWKPSTGTYVPEVGETVLIDGAMAKITAYNPKDGDSGDWYSANIGVGNSMNIISGHISNTRFVSLEEGGFAVQHKSELDEVVNPAKTIADPQEETAEEGKSRTGTDDTAETAEAVDLKKNSEL